MQGIFCSNLTEDSVTRKFLLLHKRELYCAYAFIITWEVVYLNKQTNKNLAPIQCIHFSSFNAPTTILTALELVTDILWNPEWRWKKCFFPGHEVLYFFKNVIQLSASANLPFFHAQLHFLQFPCIGASSHVAHKASPGLLFWHARLDSHHISKMMLLSLCGCIFLVQSREQ